MPSAGRPMTTRFPRERTRNRRRDRRGRGPRRGGEGSRGRGRRRARRRALAELPGRPRFLSGPGQHLRHDQVFRRDDGNLSAFDGDPSRASQEVLFQTGAGDDEVDGNSRLSVSQRKHTRESGKALDVGNPGVEAFGGHVLDERLRVVERDRDRGVDVGGEPGLPYAEAAWAPKRYHRTLLVESDRSRAARASARPERRDTPKHLPDAHVRLQVGGAKRLARPVRMQRLEVDAELLGDSRSLAETRALFAFAPEPGARRGHPRPVATGEVDEIPTLHQVHCPTASTRPAAAQRRERAWAGDSETRQGWR